MQWHFRLWGSNIYLKNYLEVAWLNEVGVYRGPIEGAKPGLGRWDDDLGCSRE